MTTIVGLIDVFCGLMLLWSALRITTRAGLRTIQARWALFRRLVYGASSIALFGLGLGRFEGDYPLITGSQALFQILLLFGVVVFPLLRALGWISQDQFKTVDGSYEQRGERERI